VNFFASYHNISEDEFNPLGNDGPEVAIKLIKNSIKKAQDTNNGSIN